MLAERVKSFRYFRENYSREERYLISFADDFKTFLSSASWLQSDQAKVCQKFYDFQVRFESLRKKMAEFKWSKEFLKANGIDFVALKKLYYSVV
jgi:hypothetical protein